MSALRALLYLTLLLPSSQALAQSCQSLFSFSEPAVSRVDSRSVLHQLFHPQNLIFTMAQNAGLREHIIKAEADKGFYFKNMYQTKTSNAQAPTIARFENEAIRMGMAPEELQSKVQLEMLPKYGYLQFKTNSVTGAANSKLLLKSYGEDFYTFKTAHVYDSATMTVGDSFMVLRSQLTLRKAQEMGKLKTDNSMNNRFVSFKHENFWSWLSEALFDREAQSILHKLKFTQRPVPDEAGLLEMAVMSWLKAPSIAQPFYGDGLLKLENTGLGFRRKYPYNYFEVQYFKPELKLDDVETFTFTKSPPSPEFAQILKSYGIKIYDATDSSAEPKLWLD